MSIYVLLQKNKYLSKKFNCNSLNFRLLKNIFTKMKKNIWYVEYYL